jgi:hypothetical protein
VSHSASDRPREVSPRAFTDPEALARLREYTLEVAGPRDAAALLYRIGFDRGWADGSAVARNFSRSAVAAPRFAGPALPLLFLPSEGDLPTAFGGKVHGSVEAAVHRAVCPHLEGPACHMSAGYAAGWYSAILHDTILVFEDRCESQGEPFCHFEARPVRSWIEAGDSRAAALLQYLDPPDPSVHHGEDSEESDPEGAFLGGFDPFSPAVHVWGPVMVLPYSGVEDADGALETVQEDIGPEAVRVVIVDVTGVHLAPVEACGVLDLVSRLESRGIDVLVAGVRSGHEGFLGADPTGFEGPIVVGDLTEGIARAFQMASVEEREN